MSGGVGHCLIKKHNLNIDVNNKESRGIKLQEPIQNTLSYITAVSKRYILSSTA